MKKIQRLIMFVCMFLIVGLGHAFGQDPNIICPADITISSDEDYTDTGVTGIATAFDINGEVDVEFTDIIINLNSNNEGFVRRRFNVVDRSDIFCDQTINVGENGNQVICRENMVIGIAPGTTKIFAQSFVQNPENLTDIKVSRDGIFFFEFAEFFCCDEGLQPFYVQFINNEGNTEFCEGQVSVEDKLAPIIDEGTVVHLALYGHNSVELTIDMLSAIASDNCGIESATFSQSQFNAIGTYSVEYTISDVSGNTSQGNISVIVVSGNTIVCNNNVNVSLDVDGKAQITPDMILEGVVPVNGEYRVSINGGPFNKIGVMSCNHIGIENQVTVQEENTGNQCWATVIIQDKLPPILNIPETVYLTLEVPTEALLTSDMLDRYIHENCSIESYTLSQSLFNSPGTYEVMCTVVDAVGNATAQGFQVIVTSGVGSLSCKNEWTITLDDHGMATIDYFSLLESNIYLNGNFTVSLTEFPNQPSEFSENITLDCSHVGKELAIQVKNEGNGNTCWSNLTVLDRKKPTPYPQSVISVSMNGAEPYVLDPAIVDIGSFDNCGGDVSMTVSPNTFYLPGTYSVKLRAYDESGNTDFALFTLIVEQGEGIPLECLGIITALTDQWGPTTLWAIDFVINADEFDSFTMSTHPNGPYTENIDFDCSQHNLGAPFNIYVLGLNDGISSSCTVSLTLIDNKSPIAVVDDNIVLELVNGQATLTPAMVDDGSYDNCGEVSLSLSQTLFTTAHLGENQVILTVTDESGNTNQGFVIVTVVGDNTGSGCTVNHIIFPSDISITDVDGEVENISVENLQSIYNYTYHQVYPYTVSQCDHIVYAYEDQIIVTVVGFKVIRTFTALDWLSNSIKTDVQLINLFTSHNTTLTCIENLTINVENGSVQLFPQDFLVGGNYDFSSILLAIQDNGNNIPDNIISPNYIGQTLTYTITDTITGNSCSGTINVVDSQGGCALNIDTDVTFPLHVIYVPNANIAADQYTPEALVTNYGFELSEVDVSIHAVESCVLIGRSYEDVVFNYADGNYKIVRTFTVIDWYTYDPPSTEGIYTHVQTINVGINPNQLICDVLPNSAPAGGCDTGHTLDDDVEWPSDLSVADYRITPDGLIEFSSVAQIDARPIFFNNPDHYTATYLDLLVELTSSTLTVARVWKAVNINYDLVWHYSQTIVVDFSGFENLVTVNTTTDRAVPGVIFNNSSTTNMDGEAQVLEEIVTINFEDDALNGVNIKDLVLLERHKNQIELLEGEALIAADLSGDGNITPLDANYLNNLLVGNSLVGKAANWEFSNEIDDENFLSPKGQYRAIKFGDLNDDAIFLGDNEQTPEIQLEIEDQLLNNGETYEIPIRINDPRSLLGLEVRIKINHDLLDIEYIESYLNSILISRNINSEGEFVFLLSEITNPVDKNSLDDNIVVNIRVKANSNGLLHDAITIGNRLSYAVDEELNLIVLSGKIENLITDTKSPELASLKVFPNPTSDYLRIDQSGVSVKGDLNISIFNTQGQLVVNQTSDIVDVQDLSQGMYYYKITIGAYETKGKFIVIR